MTQDLGTSHERNASRHHRETLKLVTVCSGSEYREALVHQVLETYIRRSHTGFAKTEESLGSFAEVARSHGARKEPVAHVRDPATVRSGKAAVLRSRHDP